MHCQWGLVLQLLLSCHADDALVGSLSAFSCYYSSTRASLVMKRVVILSLLLLGDAATDEELRCALAGCHVEAVLHELRLVLADKPHVLLS